MPDSTKSSGAGKSTTTDLTGTSTSTAKTPAEQRGEFNTSPDRQDPYSTTTETEAEIARRAAEEKYERSIEGQELPPSYETQQEIEAERAAEAEKAQKEAAKPDSYTQAMTAGEVGQPAPTTQNQSATTDR
jgi:hypothetical protein